MVQILNRYECKFPNKKIGLKTEIQAGDDSNLDDSLTIQCQMDGTYNADVDEYGCTPPCPYPSNPHPEIIEHDYDMNSSKPEIYQTVT